MFLTHAARAMSGGRSTLLLLATALLLAGCASPAGPAPDVGDVEPEAAQWTPVGHQAGLVYEREAREPGQVLHWLRLDLQDPTLQLTLTPPAEKGRPLDRFDGAAQALAALNASFFTAAFEPRGWTVSEGQAWAPVLAAADSPLLSCDRLGRCQMTLSPPVPSPPSPWLAVAGTPWLVRNGQARQPGDDQGCGFCITRHPRTAVGLDASGRYLTLVLVEGRQVQADGLALADLAARMAARGVHQGLNLDGGGSTALLIEGRLVTGRPFNEPALRPLANALLIHTVAHWRIPAAAGTPAPSPTADRAPANPGATP
ncbi:Predicted protein [Roseateles sp. YR242]|nr:Predicted protein [Roseateles sp. YR242]